ncbi:ABC transporter substrate-binding protein [Microbacterium sp.]|uniref:ABC transporter substrate-binding protein n=1 Tax=Microbacterium sp. TaxID=51671 RepID=UPI0032214C54
MRTSRIALTALALATSLTLASCAGGSGSPSPSDAGGEPQSGGTLTYLAGAEPPVWDGQRIPSLGANSINSSIFDTLIAQDEDGGYQPNLATDWEISDDGLTYTFTLREGVTFHDGTPFDAAVLKQNLDRPLGEPDLATVSTGIASTEVVDEHTLAVTLSRPNAAFIHALSTPHWPIYSGAVLSAHSPAELSADPTLSIGTGPFKVAKYTKGSSLVLERNDDYDWAPETWDHTGPAYLDEVVIQFVPEPQARIGALTSDQADAIDQVPPLNIPEVEAAGDEVLTKDNTGTPYYLALNPNRPPFDDKNVRLAFREAIDIDGLLKGVYAGVYEKAWSTTLPDTPPKGSFDESLVDSWGYDLDEATALLEKAGYDEVDSEGYRVKDGQRLHVDWYVDSLYVQTDQRQQLGEAIASSLKDAGFEVVRTPFDTSSFTAELAKGEHNLADASRGFADVGTSVVPFWTRAIPSSNGGSGINYGLLSDPALDEAYGIISTSLDPDARIEAAHAAQNRILDEGFAVPLYIPKKIVGVTPAVHGWKFDAVGYTDSFFDVWLSD